MRSVLYSFALLACLPMGAVTAAAQDEEQSDTDTQDEGDEDEDEIVVRAPPSDQNLIDRDSYIVRDTPAAQAKTASEIIGILPSVNVDANGRIRLLGNMNVAILFDGLQVPNTQDRLRSLDGSQIARIEVITNPSGEFANYSGGVINVILRKTFRQGLGGAVTVTGANPGSFTAKVAPTWAHDRWSISLTPGMRRTKFPSESRLERRGLSGADLLDRVEERDGNSTSIHLDLNGQVRYNASQTKSYTFDAAWWDGRGDNDSIALINSPLDAFAPITESRASDFDYDGYRLSLARRAEGAREGELLTSSIGYNQSIFDFRRLEVADGDAGYQLFNSSRGDRRELEGKLDYNRPTAFGVFKVGGEFEFVWNDSSEFTTGATAAGPIFVDQRFETLSRDLGTYMSAQASVGSVKLLPSLRLQSRRYSFADILNVDPVAEAFVLPSVHVERPFGKVTGTFSVARKVSWPAIQRFLPSRIVTSPTEIFQGNSDLRPQISWSSEVGARFDLAKQQITAKAYLREADNVQGQRVIANDDGLLITTPVNLGSRQTMGMIISARGRIEGKLRYSTSLWAADARFNNLLGDVIVRTSSPEYGGNFQLDYERGNQKERDYRAITINLNYYGPLRYFQGRSDEYWTTSVSYSQNLTGQLTISASVRDLIGSQSSRSVRTGSVFEDVNVRDVYGPVAKITLTRRLGQ